MEAEYSDEYEFAWGASDHYPDERETLNSSQILARVDQKGKPSE
jgi:hypothetical protein